MTGSPGIGRRARPRAWALRAVATLAVVLALAAGAVFGLRAFQHQVAYHPSRSPLPPAAQVLPGAQEIELTTQDGLHLVSWFLPPAPDAPSRAQAVLLAHGNGGNLAGRANLAAELAYRGFAVMLVGYRGFGGSPGTPAEDGLVLDAVAAQQWLAARDLPAERTIYLGESIGTGVVAGLAARVPPAGLVLRSPFTSFADVAGSMVPLPAPVLRFMLDRNVYPVAAQIAASDVPVTVLAGSADELVPPAQSQAVADTASHLIEHLVIDGARHNDGVWLGPVVADAVARLADEVIPRRASAGSP